MKDTMKKTFGSLTAKIAAALLAFGLGSTAWALSGTGTSADPYLIGTLADLQEFRDAVNGGNTYADQYIKIDGRWYIKRRRTCFLISEKRPYNA